MSLGYHPLNISIVEILVFKHKATSGADEDICKAVPEHFFLSNTFYTALFHSCRAQHVHDHKNCVSEFGTTGKCILFSVDAQLQTKQEFGSCDV